jgi:hypothetical protein
VTLEEVGFSDDIRIFFFFCSPEIEGAISKNNFQSAFWIYINSAQFLYTFIVNKLSHRSVIFFSSKFQLTFTPYKKQVVYNLH